MPTPPALSGANFSPQYSHTHFGQSPRFRLNPCRSLCWIPVGQKINDNRTRVFSKGRCAGGSARSSDESKVVKLGFDLPSQAKSIVEGPDIGGVTGLQLEEKDKKKPPSEVDYLAELIAIQQNGPKNIGFFGTRNMGFAHQQLVEILSYALVSTGNHIFTSGATGTNAAVIRGALRAETPEQLTVILPQSLGKQPEESQELLQDVQNVIEMPHNNDLSLFDASKLCNQEIISRVQQIICFAFHDSRLMLETCKDAKELRKIVTLWYLD